MDLKITNYYYQILGLKYWYASLDEAVEGMKIRHPALYRGCISPINYVQKHISIYSL